MGRRMPLAAWLAAGMSGVLAITAGRRIWAQAHAMDLDGRVVLLTGASRGLGLALARECARQGARLAICARDEAALERARVELADTGAQVLAVPCNVEDRMRVEQLVAEVRTHYGRIDVLVNNAGSMTVGAFETLLLDDFDAAMNTMFWGGVFMTLAVLPDMLERGDGRIVNITSLFGKVSVPHLLAYSSAKFAMVGFSEGLRAEVARRGVGVVTVAPGLMRTGSAVNANFKGRHQAEYTWFALSDSLPLTSISAAAAARRIMAATRRGEAEVLLSPQARVLALAHGIAPGLTVDALGLVNRLLPRAGGIGQDALSGSESETALTASILNALGRRAAQLYGQRPPVSPATSETPTGGRPGPAERHLPAGL